MARGTIPAKAHEPIAAASSDYYGSDFDEEAVNELILHAEQTRDSRPELSIANKISEQDPVVQDAPSSLQRSVVLHGSEVESGSRSNLTRAKALHPHRFREDAARPIRVPSSKPEENNAAHDEPEQPGEDVRAPLNRFRSKRPLSVTDLVSPAWCEQQYWYSLTRFGSIPKTKAMRQGSRVHKVLEEQVHREVKVDVQTREEMFGLRIWNVIQGLRTLRATGMTREMEVWGMLEGEVVNGIIDEINVECPDAEAEARLLKSEDEGRNDAKRKTKPLEKGQKTLVGFMQNSQNGDSIGSVDISGHDRVNESCTFYISDVKTRQSRTIPADGSASRNVYIQLMLYRRLFGSFAVNETPAEQVFQRYNLDAEAAFSNTFIGEIGHLDYHSRNGNADFNLDFNGSQDSIAELLAHNSLSSLWNYMTDEFACTIPQSASLGTDTRHPVSRILSAEYRSASSGDVIGKKTFIHDDKVLDAYIGDEIKWWRGERPTRGVEMEDNFKCGICEFAEGCTWRLGKLEADVKKAKLKREMRKSEV